jgi:chromosomal replication initiation ATPase DnaA
LGDDLFVEKVLADKTITRKPEFNAIVKYACKQFGVTEKQTGSLSRQRKIAEVRGIVGWLTTRLGAVTLSAVAKRFNRELTTISRAVRNIEERMLQSKEMKKQLDSYLKELRDNAITQA